MLKEKRLMDKLKKAGGTHLVRGWYFFDNGAPSVEHLHEDKGMTYLPMESADGLICRVCGDPMPEQGIAVFRLFFLKNPPMHNLRLNPLPN